MLIPISLMPDAPLQRQLYDQLRDLVAQSRLRPGTRLPSTRMLADQLDVSRVTVLLAYERLIADGFLETRPARGTFVSQKLPCASTGAVRRPAERQEAPARAHPTLEAVAGEPDPALFPIARWRGLLRNALSRIGGSSHRDDPAGSQELRQAIAGWMSRSRGLVVTPEQVIVLNGRQQALHLATRLACPAGRPMAGRVVVEDPSSPRGAAFEAAGAQLVRVPVDGSGLRTHLLPQLPAGLVHVTPEHQRPLGVTLSGERRVALLDWAEGAGALVLEEDCDGELRYAGTQTPALLALDAARGAKSGRVIWMGGFGVSLGPWLSLAWLVVPPRLVNPALAALLLIDDGHRGLEEAAMAEFLDSGGYSRHLHRVTRQYGGRCAALRSALRANFGETDPCLGGQAGLTLTWFPPPSAGSAAHLADLARCCGLACDHVPTETLGDVVVFGFGALDEAQIEARVALFARQALADVPVSSASAD